MAKLETPINDVDAEAQGFWEKQELVPAGWYKAVILGDEEVVTSTGGKAIKMKFQIQEAAQREIKIWINHVNANAQAQAIARATVSKIAQAVGHPKGVLLNDTGVLHGRPMEIKVTIEDDNRDKDIKRNKIVDYRPINSGGALGESGGGTKAKAPLGW